MSAQGSAAESTLRWRRIRGPLSFRFATCALSLSATTNMGADPPNFRTAMGSFPSESAFILVLRPARQVGAGLRLFTDLRPRLMRLFTELSRIRPAEVHICTGLRVSTHPTPFAAACQGFMCVPSARRVSHAPCAFFRMPLAVSCAGVRHTRTSVKEPTRCRSNARKELKTSPQWGQGFTAGNARCGGESE